MSAKFKFESSLICEQMRIENNGKLILLGVYPADIALFRLPASFSVVLFASGQIIDAGFAAPSLRVTDETGAIVFRSVDHMVHEAMEFAVGPFVLNVAALISLHKETVLTFSYVIEGEEFPLVTKRVVIGGVGPKPE
jgi:hypothetical protein